MSMAARFHPCIIDNIGCRHFLPKSRVGSIGVLPTLFRGLERLGI